MRNRLRFNMMVRLFFAGLVLETDRPGLGWREGKKKGELPECNTRIAKFAFAPDFATYMQHNNVELPEAFKNAETYSENLSESQGFPSDCTRTDLSLQFIDSLSLFFVLEHSKYHASKDITDPNQVGCFSPAK